MTQSGAQEPFSGRQWILLSVFALSGFTGLIYESIWSHYLKLFLGHAAYAQTLVLAIFMGGMAVGAWLISRGSTRLRNLLVVYASVELLVGLAGLGFDWTFRQLIGWTFSTVIPSMHSSSAIQGFKWLAGAFLILPQSILLGMTFPLISGALIRLAPQRSGECLALLYFTNCLGAAVGVLFSGFYLIGTVGLPGTLLTAGVLNVLIATAVWILGKRTPLPWTNPARLNRAEENGKHSWLIWAAFLTGTASFFYEVAWIRMLSLVLGSSTHSFELMLAAFIFGLAFGGLWIRRRIDGLAEPAVFLCRILLLMAMLAALTVPGYHYTFNIMAWAKSAFAPTESGYLGFNLVSQSLAMMLMVPVTFLAGTTLPLITHLLMKQGSDERAIGLVYAVNTLGCIVGVVAAVHVLMPSVGLKGTILCGTLVTIAVAVVGLVRCQDRLQSLKARGLALAAAITAAVVIVAVHPDSRRMVSAVYRTGAIELGESAEVIYLRDGKTATISLVREAGTVTIATNGKPDAAIEMGAGPPAADEVTMIMAGALPLSLHPSPKRVANIGIGSGLTSSTLLATPEVETLTSIEIEPFMVEAARIAYMPRVARLFEDPRSSLVFEDAKTFFAASGTNFDVIVSEPSNPWVSGVATLFSEEFYRQVARYLAPDGMLVQWLQTYETDVSVVMSVLRALSPSFDDYQVYNVDDSNVLVVAKRGSDLGDPDSRIFASGGLRDELHRAGITGIEDLTSRRIGNKRLLDPLVRRFPAPANSDYFPYVDQNASRFRFLNRNAVQLAELTMLPVPFLELALPEWRTLPLAPVPEFARGYRETLANRAGLIAASVAVHNLDLLPAEIARSILVIEDPPESCRVLGYRRAWLDSVFELNKQTTPFLPYQDLAALWAKVRSSDCYTNATADERIWPDFLYSIAKRDRREIARLGTILLDKSMVRSQTDEPGYVLTATAGAMYGSGDPAAAAATVEKWAGTVQSPGQFDLALRILAAAAAPS